MRSLWRWLWLCALALLACANPVLTSVFAQRLTLPEAQLQQALARPELQADAQRCAARIDLVLQHVDRLVGQAAAQPPGLRQADLVQGHVDLALKAVLAVPIRFVCSRASLWLCSCGP